MNKLTYIGMLLFSACATAPKEFTKQEEAYTCTADSLKKYHVPLLNQFGTLPDQMTDYMTMDYAAYRKKYNLTDQEIDAVTQQFTVTYQTVKLAASMNDQLEQISEGTSTDSITETAPNYSLDKNNEPASEKELDIFNQAQDKQITPK